MQGRAPCASYKLRRAVHHIHMHYPVQICPASLPYPVIYLLFAGRICPLFPTLFPYFYLGLTPFQYRLYCIGAILKLFVQASKCHRNPWKSHFLPQKVPQSTIWNGSSVKWTLVDLDFAFVNDFQFSVWPSSYTTE